MLFNSYSYLIFLPAAALVYFLLPAKLRNLWLLAASLFFYGCWKAEYTLLILFSVGVTYACGRLIAAADASGAPAEGVRRRKKAALLSSLAINLAILFFFKYFNFVAQTLAALLHGQAIPFLPSSKAYCIT